MYTRLDDAWDNRLHVLARHNQKQVGTQAAMVHQVYGKPALYTTTKRGVEQNTCFRF